MLDVVCDYLDADDGIPMLNDTNYGHAAHMYPRVEFAYRELGGGRMAYFLNSYYKNHKRDSLDAFLYGVDTIEEASFEKKNYHTEIGKPGHTILRGKDGRYLLFKHDRYGGEHDHYDRLGISYQAYGKPISRDLGTTGYGAVMHYDYYKNTGTNNTCVIGEENQAPADGRLTRYEERDGVVYVEAEADWTAPYEMPDSFTIVQWS
ncbi:MAG: heparinase II/III family protein, partial [Lachnospiraceae bacterium]|nr:heparinase II/III family protein [Lachnospiraceae bacterium]